MTHSPKQLIAAAMLAALGLVAVAQTPPPPAGSAPTMRERMGRFDPARMQERIAKRLTRLKETLQITAPQEGAWTAWAAAMQPPANWKRPDRAEFERLTTPERIDRMHSLRTERMAMMDKRAEATKAFYASLSPVQKRVFDLETARHGHGRGDGGGHRGEHRHHMG